MFEQPSVRTDLRRVKVWRPLLGMVLLSAALAGCATGPSAPSRDAMVSSPAVTVPPRQVLPEIAGPEAGFTSAIDAFRKGNLESASLYAQSVMARYPHTAWQKRSLYLYGRTLLSRGMTAEGGQVMLRVPGEYPDLADYALFALAEHHAAQKRPADAAALYQRLMENHPASPLAVRAALGKAQVLFDAGAFREAAAAYERVLADFPRTDQAVEAAMGLGRSRAEAGDLAGAVRAYLMTRVRYPGAATDGDTEKALAQLAARGAAAPKLTADEQYERGRNLQRMLQFDKAAEAFRAALEADPAHPQKADILLRSGIALFYLGKRPEAASTLERLLSAKLPDCRCAEALNWLGKSYSRLGLREEAVASFRKLVRLYPDSEWADDALYLTGNVYRDAGDLKQAIKHYRRLVEEYPDSSFADSGLWWEGWSRYLAGDYARAGSVFRELARRYPRSFLANQALYWQGRAAERTGDRAKAQRLYRRVLARGPYTFYGYRAAERLGEAELPVAAASAVPDGEQDEDYAADLPAAGSDASDDAGDPAGPPVWADDAVAALSASTAYRKTLELMYLDMKQEAAAELRAFLDLVPGRHGALIGVSKAFFELGDYYSSLTIILRNFERSLERPSARLPEDLWLLAYPRGYWQSIIAASRKYGMDPFFVAAIIREESQFRPAALSPAGARGVMQVMPSTGEWIARNAGIAGFDRSGLFDADMNIAVGTWYLGHLMKRFQGDLYRVSAAYNAGPEAVAAWSNAAGPADPVTFVESIPYRETRGYVKKVLRNYAEYRRLYGGAAAVSLRPVPVAAAAKSSAGVQTKGTLVCQATGSCPGTLGGR